MRAQAGLSLFFEKRSIFPQGTEKNPVRASKPRIVTINNIDGVSGLRTAHTRWAQKYPSFFDQILNPLFGCKKPIMSPSKIYLHFSHIEKTLKKAVQELVDFCMVFLKTFYEINDWLTFFPRNDWFSLEVRHSLVIYLIDFKIPSKKSCVFYENPDSNFIWWTGLSARCQELALIDQIIQESSTFCWENINDNSNCNNRNHISNYKR